MTGPTGAGGRQAAPSLGIVVPFHDVRNYLPRCLKSLAAQSVPDIEVIMVDDGSTDGSGAVAAGFADRDPRFRVLHIDHSGPGRARNVGLEAVTAEHIAFVDGDDEVVDDGFERLLSSLRASRSDIATGRVTRITSTRSYPSALHTRALPAPRTRTHISRQPSLLYDVTMWNKVFRSDFWRHHGFRYPEGVVYEDIALATRTHALSLAVDVLTGPVYRWRERDDGSLSITQRRFESGNLRDRVAALTSITGFLSTNGLESLRSHHDTKALGTDLALYLAELPDADDAYVEEFMALVGGFLRSCTASGEARLAPALRLKYQLIRAGRTDALIELLRYEQEHTALPVRRRGRKMVLTVPDSTTAALPPSALDMSRRLPLRSGVEAIRWAGGDLVIEGYAHLEAVPVRSPVIAARRLILKEIGSTRRRTIWLRPRRSPRRTAAAGEPNLPYDWCGFRVRVPAERLAPTGNRTTTTWEVVVQVLTPVAAKGAALGPAASGAAWLPPIGHHLGLVVVPHWKDSKSLRLTVSRGRCELVAASFGAGGIALRISIPTAQWGDAPVLRVEHDGTAVDAVVTSVAVQGDRTIVAADLRAVDLPRNGKDRLELPLYLIGTAGPVRVAMSMAGEVAAVVDDREILVRRAGDGDARIVLRPPWVVATAATFSAGALTVTGRNALSPIVPEIFLRGPGGERIVGRTEDDDEGFTTTFNLMAVPSATYPRPVRPGRWTLMRVPLDQPGTPVTVPAATDAAPAIESAVSTGPLQLDTWVDRYRSVSVTVHALPLAERGRFHQHRLRTEFYQRELRRPLTDTILFECWQGKQYSDNPRAIAEELAQRGDHRRRVWVVTDLSVPVPPGTQVVVRGSREYFRALATARYLVANDTTTPSLIKRPGQVYLQTWHGTPFKRIGFDIETIRFRNKKYLEELPAEVAKWDHLISPDPWSTEVLRSAFRFDGTMLTTGYPRNDVLTGPDATQVRRRVRDSLGIDQDATVALWAPTWRDHQYDRSGRYTMAMNEDVLRMADALPAPGVLLFRGHHLVRGSIDSDAVPAGVRNVSDYPDIAELYLAADALISDYSSAMFDFAVLRRPILIYAWDLAEYRDDVRGFYLDFDEIAPGPIGTDIGDITAALGDLSGYAAANRERLEAFATRFCGLSDGRAAARVVDQVFGPAG